VADPLEDGLKIATEAGILEHVGGPGPRDLKRLRANAALGELVRVVVPKTGDGRGLRLLVRARNVGSEPGKVWVGIPHGVFSYDSKGRLTKARKVPEIHPKARVFVEVPAGGEELELHTEIPAEFGLGPGKASFLVVLAARQIEVEAIAVVPTQPEIASVGATKTVREAATVRPGAGEAPSNAP
jgi:hypothetical protein